MFCSVKVGGLRYETLVRLGQTDMWFILRPAHEKLMNNDH